MMPRKHKNLSVEDLKLIRGCIESDTPFPDELLIKLHDWVESELERREKSGKAGGRPKKVGASPELMKALNHLLPKEPSD